MPTFSIPPLSPTTHKPTPHQLPKWLQQTLHESHLSDVDLHQHAGTLSTTFTRAHRSQWPHNTSKFALLCNVLHTHENTRAKEALALPNRKAVMESHMGIGPMPSNKTSFKSEIDIQNQVQRK